MGMWVSRLLKALKGRKPLEGQISRDTGSLPGLTLSAVREPHAEAASPHQNGHRETPANTSEDAEATGALQGQTPPVKACPQKPLARATAGVLQTPFDGGWIGRREGTRPLGHTVIKGHGWPAPAPQMTRATADLSALATVGLEQPEPAQSVGDRPERGLSIWTGCGVPWGTSIRTSKLCASW